MSDEKPKSTILSNIPDQRKPGDPPPEPYKTTRPQRRRKGYLNDGQWAPGYGPDAKKK
ncbi:MAG: hypothetical protein WAU68_01745 [Vitreimonas sp.]